MDDSDRPMPTYPRVDSDHVDPKSAWLRFAAAQLEKAAEAHDTDNWGDRDVHVSEAFVGLEEAAGSYEHLEGILRGGSQTSTDRRGKE